MKYWRHTSLEDGRPSLYQYVVVYNSGFLGKEAPQTTQNKYDKYLFSVKFRLGIR